MKKALIVAAGVAVLGLVLWASLRGGGGGTPVEIAPAQRRTVTRDVKATGTVEPARKVEISAKVAGEIVRLPVHEGATVQAGDLLVEIEPEAYRANRDQARAALAQARAAASRAEVQKAEAERLLRQAEHLAQSGHVSAEEVEQARLRLRLADAELTAARHQITQQRYALERADEDLTRTTIRSPMAGQVIRLEVEQGEAVVPGTMNLPGSVLMTVADLSRILAEVEVNEVDVVDVEPGQTVDVRIEALGDTVLQGEVVEIATSGTADPQLGVVRFPVKVALREPDPRLRPGMTAKVDIHTAVHPDVVTVPIQAVVKRALGEDGQVLTGAAAKTVEPAEVVFVARNGTVDLTRVKTGISDALHVEVTEGLDPETPVVVGPYRSLRNLKPGAAVHEKAPEEADEDEAEDGEETGEAEDEA